jgi:hypothetical protein
MERPKFFFGQYSGGGGVGGVQYYIWFIQSLQPLPLLVMMGEQWEIWRDNGTTWQTIIATDALLQFELPTPQAAISQLLQLRCVSGQYA